jgi:hypothetical protein
LPSPLTANALLLQRETDFHSLVSPILFKLQSIHILSTPTRLPAFPPSSSIELHHFLHSSEDPKSQRRLVQCSLPVFNMLHDNTRRTLRRILSSNTLHEVPLRIHNIKINAMIHQIVLPGFNILGRAKINPILLTHVLRLLVRPCQANNAGMELI